YVLMTPRGAEFYIREGVNPRDLPRVKRMYPLEDHDEMGSGPYLIDNLGQIYRYAYMSELEQLTHCREPLPMCGNRRENLRENPQETRVEPSLSGEVDPRVRAEAHNRSEPGAFKERIWTTKGSPAEVNQFADDIKKSGDSLRPEMKCKT